MGKINSRAKGAAGEREFCKELAEYLGDDLVAPLKRNLEQTRMGGHDIEGLEGWAIEIKRYRVIKEGDINRFWTQAVDQAKRVGAEPVLAYREDFRSWRVRLPWGFGGTSGGFWSEDVEMTVEVSLKAFACIVREHLRSDVQKSEAPDTVAA